MTGLCSSSPHCLRPALFSERPFEAHVLPPASWCFSADELDAVTRKAGGGDAAGDIRRLEDSLERLRDDFEQANKLATAAEEAAAKCQVGALVVLFLPVFIFFLSFQSASPCPVMSIRQPVRSFRLW